MKELNLYNAKITSTSLGMEHGCFTFMLDLSFNSSGQSFGGRAHIRAVHIMQVLEIVGVKRWEDLKGKLVRIIQDNERVYAIGHITEDVWLWPTSDIGQWPFGTLEEIQRTVANEFDIQFRH